MGTIPPIERGDNLQERTFTISSTDMACLLMLSTAIEDIINNGAVSEDIMEELEVIQPQLERLVYDNI